MRVILTISAGLAAGACGMAAGQTTQPASLPLGTVPISEGAVTRAEARQTALSLAQVLGDNYVNPDVAKRYAAALRAKAEAGSYDQIRTPGELAQRLTRDLQEIAPDRHLRVMSTTGLTPGVPRMRILGGTGDTGAPPPPPAVGPSAAGPGSGARSMPPPIQESGWIAPGIAYIRFNLFPNDPAVTEAARRFMADHADAKTIIFDVRTHFGGGLSQMDAMLPYLFDRETVLATTETRASVARRLAAAEANFMLRVVPGPADVVRREHFVKPHPSERRLLDANVFVLTSPLTASAGEAFALSMKSTGRATLIGETTAGAGNYGAPLPVSSRFSAFVPMGATFDPRTGQRWEGEGIQPDVAVSAERALSEALVRSGVALGEAERIASQVGPQGPFLAPGPRGPGL